MHNTERDNRALFSLFFFFLFAANRRRRKRDYRVLQRTVSPHNFPIKPRSTTGSRVQFYFEKFPRKFFFSYLDSVENLTIRFPTERATAFSLIPREILCSIKDWEGKIRYQPAIGEIDGEELQREREREKKFWYSFRGNFTLTPSPPPSNAPAAVFHLFERFSPNRQRVFLPLRHPRPETSALCERTADFRLTFSTA